MTSVQRSKKGKAVQLRAKTSVSKEEMVVLNSEVEAKFGSLRVLIVEDNNMNQMICKSMFTQVQFPPCISPSYKRTHTLLTRTLLFAPHHPLFTIKIKFVVFDVFSAPSGVTVGHVDVCGRWA
jgi:hypothetical protein